MLVDEPEERQGAARRELEALAGVEARILFAPRHVERSDEVVASAKALGYEVGLRSLGEFDRQLVVLDTLGELAGAYAGADIAIVGGGFSRLGGQNLIQPMAVGVPVICG
ncbi:MAG: 3-deoxy-D-manno-octulosonic acid transferase, partial [Candidatus Rokubacteria bacterium]|nr:3-deoxy-D-manno-octulosonic acid transferase [Candidatus Rokubacteria bacterium]